jgi:Holliday junction resolvase RusA-like endonuclease
MTFDIPWDYCVSKGNKKQKWSGNRIALTEKYRASKHAVHMIALCHAQEIGWKPIEKGMSVSVAFVVHFPSGRQRDPANYTENILDALEGVAYENDNQVVEMSVLLAGYDKENARIKVVVTDLNRPMPLLPSRQPKSRRQPKAQ